MNDLDLINVSNNLYILLLSLNRHIFNPHELTKKFNVPHSHIKVLFYLRHHGPASISTMAKDLCISKPNMTPVIDKLVDDGLVIRDYDPSDRRVIIVESTEKASELFKCAENYSKELAREKLSNLDNSDLSKLSSLLEETLTIVKKL